MGVGGIVGDSFGNIEMINCSNFGKIINTGESTGGIIGRSENTTNISNSFNVGEISSIGMQAGGICGYRYDISKSNLTIDNSCYLSNTCSIAVGNEEDSQYGVTKVESLTNEELKNYLNIYIQTENQEGWKKWKLGEDGYPVFE